MVSTHELSDSPDLCCNQAKILKKYQFPLDLLDQFSSKRLDLSDINDPEEIERKTQDQQQRYRSKLQRWAREVQTLNIDWPRLIDELQPLLVENYRRHLRQDHPSQFGVVWHLDYHYFKRVRNIEVSGNHAEGSIVAIVRDPDAVTQNDLIGQPSAMNFSDSLEAIFRSITLTSREVKRDPDRIEFVREGENWKITLVPFR